MKNHVLKNSFDKYEPDYGPMKHYMKKKGLCEITPKTFIQLLENI